MGVATRLGFNKTGILEIGELELNLGYSQTKIHPEYSVRISRDCLPIKQLRDVCTFRK